MRYIVLFSSSRGGWAKIRASLPFFDGFSWILFGVFGSFVKSEPVLSTAGTEFLVKMQQVVQGVRSTCKIVTHHFYFNP